MFFRFRHKSFAVVLLGYLAISSLATAGANGGGGGAALLCYKSEVVRNQILRELQLTSDDKNHHIQKMVDLRLSELESMPHLLEVIDAQKPVGLFSPINLAVSGEASVWNIYKTIKQVDPQFWNIFYSSVTDEKQWINEPAGVTEIDDATFSDRFPDNCLVVQVARFDDATKNVHVDQRLIDIMGAADKVALKLHEDLYSFYRSQVSARKFILGRFVDDNAFRACGVFGTPYCYESVKKETQTEIINQHLQIDIVNSDTVRELVTFLLTHDSYSSLEFYTVASKVAVSLFEDTSRINGVVKCLKPVYSRDGKCI